MRTVLAPFAVAVLILAACATVPPPADGLAWHTPSDSDAGVTFPDDDARGVKAGEPCALSYRVLRSCHCGEARRTEGVAFPEWCRSMGFAVDSPCIAKAPTCKALPACHVKCVTET